MKFLFDCDDTLYDLSWPFQMCVKEFHLDIPEDKMNTFYARYRFYGDEIFYKIQAGEISVDQSGAYRIYQACKEYQIPFSKQQAIKFQDRYKYYQTKISMSSYYLEYFSTTKSELGILTNGDDLHQRKKLKTLDVFRYIPKDHIFTSGQLSVAKPDVRAFQSVMMALHDQPENWYYVGDNYINDMQGAKKTGMHTIHFNRHHQQEGPCSDYVVYSEEELIQLLEKLEGCEKHG